MSADNTTSQGPARGVLSTAQRIVTIIVGMVETRLRLAVVELEEEKANVIQLLMMAGVTLLFTAFGLMTLLVLLFLAIDPVHRLMALGDHHRSFAGAGIDRGNLDNHQSSTLNAVRGHSPPA
jgi:uncharacterized membrane protein YqjE